MSTLGSRAAVSQILAATSRVEGIPDVERVLRRDAVLHHGQQRRLGGVGEVGHGRAFGLRIVVQQVDRSSRRGDETDARAIRQPPAGEREGGFDEIVERAVIDDAVALAHREIAGIVARDGAGVGLRGRLRLHGCAGLDRQDRFAHGERAAGRMHECLSAANAFDEQDDLMRLGIVDDEIEIIGESEIGFVARGDAIGKAQAALGRGFHPELDSTAGLEDAGDRAGSESAQFGVGISEQTLAIGICSHAIRPGHAQAAVRHEVGEPGAARLRFRFLAVADHGRIDGGGFDAGLLRVGEHARNRRGRHDHQRMVDRLGQFAQRRKATLAVDVGLPRIDQRNRSGIAELAQVLENLARPPRSLGRAYDGKRLRPERADSRTK